METFNVSHLYSLSFLNLSLICIQVVLLKKKKKILNYHDPFGPREFSLLSIHSLADSLPHLFQMQHSKEGYIYCMFRYARHGGKHILWVVLKFTIRKVVLFAPFYRWGKWDGEMFRNWPNHTSRQRGCHAPDLAVWLSHVSNHHSTPQCLPQAKYPNLVFMNSFSATSFLISAWL